MIRMMMRVHFETLADRNSTEKLASFTKNYYDALVSKGFTEEQALRIIMSVGIPSIPGAGVQK